eukprot:1365047-Amphidinium_carterae.1
MVEEHAPKVHMLGVSMPPMRTQKAHNRKVVSLDSSYSAVLGAPQSQADCLHHLTHHSARQDIDSAMSAHAKTLPLTLTFEAYRVKGMRMASMSNRELGVQLWVAATCPDDASSNMYVQSANRSNYVQAFDIF